MSEKIKILLLEDSEDDVGLVSLALKREAISFDLRVVSTRLDFADALDNYNPDTILSDHALPQFNSIEAFKMYQERKLQIPFILVTGTVSEEFAVNVIKQGVHDYVLKNNLSRLPSAMLNAIGKCKAEQDKIAANQLLKVQNEELLKINHELDNFVYSVSHNLRSPLSSVLGLINLVNTEGELGTTATKYLLMMEQNINRLDDILRDILEYSHNSRDKISNTKIDLNKLIDDCFESFQHIKGIELINREIAIDEKAPLYSDYHRFSTLFKNILSNSIQYRDKSKKLPVIKWMISITKKQATLNMEDNGIGIKQSLLPKVFDMFYRGTEKSKGAGLGLYIVKEIVSKLNGTIEINSEEGKGTKVVIVIPNRTK